MLSLIVEPRELLLEIKLIPTVELTAVDFILNLCAESEFSKCNTVAGLAVPIPTLLLVESTLRVEVSKVASPSTVRPSVTAVPVTSIPVEVVASFGELS